MFQLYRGYANSDRSQVAGKPSRLAKELAQNNALSSCCPLLVLLQVGHIKILVVALLPNELSEF